MNRKERPAEARPPSGGFRGRLHEVIFEADTRAGRAFDVLLIGLILLSVLAVMILRLLKIFRILKLAEHLTEAAVLMRALRGSRRKISVFLLTVLTMVVIIGTLLYVIEGEENGFTSIPVGIYWAVVTLTTVGYGDISPKTPAGPTLAAFVMIIGYGIIAVPTGIVTVEIAQAVRKPVTTQACPDCSAQGPDSDAVHCKYCGAKL